ncbi:MYND finger [Seminavis robusta]|uniref:MYND finger n=1 Tax=Seminavis robusta TaxID=568900 RepID=A0A9N8EFP9_9STRA|nr:MYND finger [Seminavis robusta]|eukprot:Sro1126_g244140.1 MYND finger (518) ;mRNA; r:34738-36481
MVNKKKLRKQQKMGKIQGTVKKAPTFVVGPAPKDGSRVHSDDAIAEDIQKIKRHELDVDGIVVIHPTFSNLPFLHYAAYGGDVRLLQEVVALGAAIDLPASPMMMEDDKVPLRQGTTALLLVIEILASYALMPLDFWQFLRSHYNNDAERHLDNMENCAIRLVELGADCSRKTVLPDSSSTSDFSSHGGMMRSAGLNGKSIKELAVISGRTRLIQAVRQFETKQDTIAKAHCRCGSRLPWMQCHGSAPKDGQHSHFFVDKKDGKVQFRLSPSAPCPCGHGEKTYFSCCWKGTHKVEYLHDEATTRTELFLTPTAFPIEEISEVFEKLKEENGLHGLYGYPKPNMSYEERRAWHADRIRSGFLSAAGMVGMQHLGEASTMNPWDADVYDPEVYAGCFERLDDYFFWTHLHWHITKLELLARVREWNVALEQYCDEKGLVGEERDAVVKKHTASPLAPCANPSCDAVEASVKEFRKCSSCMVVAYCSRSCQQEHWEGGHKGGCVDQVGDTKLYQGICRA